MLLTWKGGWCGHSTLLHRNQVLRTVVYTIVSVVRSQDPRPSATASRVGVHYRNEALYEHGKTREEEGESIRESTTMTAQILVWWAHSDLLENPNLCTQDYRFRSTMGSSGSSRVEARTCKKIKKKKLVFGLGACLTTQAGYQESKLRLVPKKPDVLFWQSDGGPRPRE